MKTTQCERIIRHLKDFGSISSLEAMRDYGIMRLASRINDLKRQGFNIVSETIAGKNRYDETTHYKVYRLAEETPKEEETPKDEPKRLLDGACFHGEIWYRCPYCGVGIEAHSIPDGRNIFTHKCRRCGGLYYYNRFERY